MARKKKPDKEQRNPVWILLFGVVFLMIFITRNNLSNNNFLLSDIWLCLAGGYCFFFGYIFRIWELKFVCHWHIFLWFWIATYIYYRNDIILGMFLGFLSIDIAVKVFLYCFIMLNKPKEEIQDENEVSNP